MSSSAFSKSIEQIKSIPQNLQSHVLEFVRVLTGSAFNPAVGEKLAVEGTYQNGTVELLEDIDKQDGQRVIVTFIEEEPGSSDLEASSWSELDNILNDCQLSTGIKDLASQHDHYRQGTPKRDV
ncbi:MAG: hypothetical protein AAFV90_22450 [Cyanobacteria bacterium J06634_5]